MNTDIKFPDLGPGRGTGVIIAMKGLPCSAKSEIAMLIGEWAKCPVLYIDDFLDSLSLQKGYTSNSMPSKEEADHLYRLAFESLCKAAQRHLRFRSKCVVVKSRLSSTFELDKLLQLARREQYCGHVLIVECQLKNEHRLRFRLESKVQAYGHEEYWYKPKSSKDIDNARDDYDSLLLDQTLFNLKQWSPRVVRLVVDPFDDLYLLTFTHLLELAPTFLHAINYIIVSWHEHERGSIGEKYLIRDQYMVIQFAKLRRYLVEKELRASASCDKSKYLCSTTGGGRCCVFNSCCEGDYYCEVCETRVASGESAYACYFCFLALHESCAEVFDSSSLVFSEFYDYPADVSKGSTCKSCVEGGNGFSKKCHSCVFETLVKDRRFPTIINHECHEEHFLSIQLLQESNNLYSCKACGGGMDEIRYGCYICQLYYHVSCVLRPIEVKHTHGGYEHMMKLMYSHFEYEDIVKQEEDYWCESCYEDMDPQLWFYSCKECPYYVAHPLCVMPDYF